MSFFKLVFHTIKFIKILPIVQIYDNFHQLSFHKIGMVSLVKIFLFAYMRKSHTLGQPGSMFLRMLITIARVIPNSLVI